MNPKHRRSAAPLALVGFVSLAAQGLLFREHLRLYGGDELGVGIFLAAWLLWIAAGSRLHRRLPGPPGLLPVLALLQPITVLLAAWLLWQGRSWAGLGPTEPFPPGRLLPLTLLALVPVSLPTGWLIPAGARWLAGGGAPGEAVGRAWAAEALGGAAGGLAVTLVLLLGTTPLALLEGPRRGALPIPAGAEVLETLDSPCTSWTAARLGDGVAFYGDGALRAHLSADGGETWIAAALLAQRPDARRAGILGAGAEALACRLLDAGLEEVTLVVRDPAWPELLRRHAPPALTPCLEDPRLIWRHGDRPPVGAAWDLAWLQHSDPSTAAAARFLSVGSLTRIRTALSEDGVLGLSITVTENVLAGPALAYARAVDATLAAVFPHRLATGGERMLFLASMAPVVGDPEALAATLDRGPAARLGVPGAALSVGFEPSHMATRRRQLDATPGRPILEQRPATHLLYLLLEGQASGDPLVGLLVHRGGVIPWLILALACGLLLVAGPRVRRGGDGVAAPAALAAFGGAAAMGWQLVLLLAWQVRFGSLAAHLGVLSGVFMLGLWGGAAGATRWLRRRPARARDLAACALGLLVAGMVLLGALALDTGWGAGAALLGASLAIGVAGGTVIPVAAALLAAAGEAPAAAAARLSVADHLGAVVAALAAGLALVPILGFGWTVILGMAGITAAGILALLAHRAPTPGGVPTGAATWRGRALLALLLGAVIALHRAAGVPDGAFGSSSGSVEAFAAGDLDPWDAVDGPVPCRVRRDTDGRVRRLRITDGAPRFPGYEGPVSLSLDLGPDGTILDAKMGPHRETPAYVRGIEDWVERLRGRPAGVLYLRGEGPPDATEVDAMTGATVTCRALLASARASGAVAEGIPDPAPAPSVDEDAEDPLTAPPPAPPEAPRLHRRDAEQTSHQRDMDREILDQRIRDGALSDHEASHYLPVGRD